MAFAGPSDTMRLFFKPKNSEPSVVSPVENLFQRPFAEPLKNRTARSNVSLAKVIDSFSIWFWAIILKGFLVCHRQMCGAAGYPRFQKKEQRK